MEVLFGLYKDHGYLMQMAKALQDTLKRDGPPEQATFETLRRAFGGKLAEHLRTEDEAVYPVLLRSRDPKVAAMARRFVEEMGGLADAYEAWAAEWTYARASGEWPTFRERTAALLDALGERIERENNELYPSLKAESLRGG